MKTLIATLFSALLIFSIMVPVVVRYMEIHIDVIFFGDFSDEEKKDKGEKDVEEKNLIVLNSQTSERFVFEEKNSLNYYYSEINQAFCLKIFLPPPEYFI